MLIKRAVLDRIVAGEITLQFRRWKKATVRAGGTLRTAVGVLAIHTVDRVSVGSITPEDARAAGYESRAELLAVLKKREGQTYRIELRYAGPDERVAERGRVITNKADMYELSQKLARMDGASRSGAWTIQYLELIEGGEGVLALELAASIGMEKKPFKARVRRLKELGLTESLKVGYRLSKRGRSFLSRYRQARDAPDSRLGIPPPLDPPLGVEWNPRYGVGPRNAATQSTTGKPCAGNPHARFERGS